MKKTTFEERTLAPFRLLGYFLRFFFCFFFLFSEHRIQLELHSEPYMWFGLGDKGCSVSFRFAAWKLTFCLCLVHENATKQCSCVRKTSLEKEMKRLEEKGNKSTVLCRIIVSFDWIRFANAWKLLALHSCISPNFSQWKCITFWWIFVFCLVCVIFGVSYISHTCFYLSCSFTKFSFGSDSTLQANTTSSVAINLGYIPSMKFMCLLNCHVQNYDGRVMKKWAGKRRRLSIHIETKINLWMKTREFRMYKKSTFAFQSNSIQKLLTFPLNSPTVARNWYL